MAAVQRYLAEHPLEREEMREKPRPRCPFYGMSLVMGTLMDTEGNQCAWHMACRGTHSPCHMEMDKKEPDWDKCQYGTAETNVKFAGAMANGRAFPIKFRPRGAPSWDGISMAAWFEHVMGRPPRS